MCTNSNYSPSSTSINVCGSSKMALNTVYHETIEDVRKEISNRDQYLELALIYDEIVGIDQRTEDYKQFFGDILKSHGCVNVLDVACGTGIDSILLLEQGFKLVSTDVSDKMLDFARRAKLSNSNDPRYEEWIIKQANWKTLIEDIRESIPDTLFDAVICLGNSFSHVFDKEDQKKCLNNFAKCLKSGGLLLLDHRNFDAVIEGQTAPKHNAYYNYKHKLYSKMTVHFVGEIPELFTFDIMFNKSNGIDDFRTFRLCQYPHRLSSIIKMLEETFAYRADIQVYADFKPLHQITVPGFYIHVIKKYEN